MTIGAITSYAVPATPSAVTTTSEDPDWTPGNWCTVDHSESSDEAESRPDAVLNTYNDLITNIASLSDARVEPVESKLESDWVLQKTRREMHVGGIVTQCVESSITKVISRKSRKPTSYPGRKRTSCCLPKRTNESLKTQILSIYAPKYTAKELKLMHSNFEKLSDRQIKKTRAHAKSIGAGRNSPKTIHHRNANRSIQAQSFFDIW